MTATAEPDRVAAVAQVTTYAADGVALLPRALRDKPRVLGLLAAWTRQLQELETALWALLTDTLETAVGAQLDQLGRLLLEPRRALDDDSYRAVLRAAVLARKSTGTAADLCAVLAAMLGAGTFTYAEGGAYVQLSPVDPVPFDATAAIAVLRLAKAGGVRLELLAPAALGTKTFTLAAGLLPEPDIDLGLGDTGDPAVGGQFAGVLV